MIILWILTASVIYSLLAQIEVFQPPWMDTLLIVSVGLISGVGCGLIDRLKNRWWPELRALRAFFRNTFRHLYAAEGRTMSLLQAEYIATGAGLMSPAENGVKLTSIGRKAIRAAK